MDFKLVLALSILFSAFINLIILRFSGKKELLDMHFKEHAIHHSPVPRIGGLGIYMSASAFMLYEGYFKLFALATLIFLIGFIEDLRKDISPKIRLAGLLIVSCLSFFLLKVSIQMLGFVKLPYVVSMILTVIAITGYTNAVNIVDGLNGLASGISLIFILFLGITFHYLGNLSMFLLCVSIAGATLGFLIFNFPKGKIFLGDGGAYFLGYISAIFSLKLIDLYPQISPWFPLMLGVYPVWEVLFSAYRRLKEGKVPFYPDKLHFHTLVYYAIGSNPAASLLIVLWCFVFAATAYVIKTCTYCLIMEFFAFTVIYYIIYRKLSHLRNQTLKQ